MIGGGFCKPDNGPPTMLMEEAVGLWTKDGSFLERAIAALLSPDGRVVIRCGLVGCKDELESIAVEAGFRLMLVEDSEGYQQDAVAIGNAGRLAEFKWLDLAIGYFETFMIASSSSPGRLERVILEAASANENIGEAIQGISPYDMIASEPLAPSLGDYSMLVSLAGHEGEDIVIQRQNGRLDDVEAAFTRIASGLGLGLYYAGSIDTPDTSGARFSEFPYYLKKCSIPEHWQRLV